MNRRHPAARTIRPRRPVAGHTNKGLPGILAATSAGQIRSAADIAALTTDVDTGGLVTPLPRSPWDPPFGPGVPLIPNALDPARSDSGRPEPRLTQYPISWNLPGTRGQHVPWRILRDAAELPLISDCIRIRKEEVATLPWEIGIARKAVAASQRDAPGTSRRSAEQSLRQRLTPEMDRLRDFWEEPDPRNGKTFPAWISQLLDERLVLDALAIWPRTNLAGDVIGLPVLDGSTIKPLLDEYGGRPAPPHPAFQQVLYGFPRGEFCADTAEDEHGNTIIAGGFRSDQLIYEVRDVRTWTPYGRSPVEMALFDLDTWMKRVGWLRAEYTDGVVPAGWLMNRQQGGQAGVWTAQQLAEYEIALNDAYGGDTTGRRRLRMLPPGWEPQTQAEVGEKFRADYDLHLLKLLVAHFDMTIHELGFTETQGLGSAGHSEQQAKLTERKGSVPTLRSIAAILTRISRKHLGMPPELEFRWVDLREDDEDADVLTAEQVAAGLMTLNEGRDELGRPRYTFPEADMAAIVSPRTGSITFLEGSSQEPEPDPADPVGPRVVDPNNTPAAQTGDGDTANDGRSSTSKRPAPGKGTGAVAKSAAKSAEAAAYRKWATKSHPRRFVLKHLRTPGDLDEFGIDPARVTFGAAPADEATLTKATTGDEWPGWVHDEAVARHWSTALTTAVSKAVDVPDLVARWNAAQPPRRRHDNQVGATTAVAFLLTAGVEAALIAAVTPVLVGAVTEGFAIGAVSAAATVDGSEADWQGWTPGNPGQARSLLTTAQTADLNRVLGQITATGGDVTAMVHDRIERIARELINADPDATLDDVMAKVEARLGDTAWAYRLILTAVVEAASEAALAVYRNAGLTEVQWITDPGSNVCALCTANAAAGPVLIGFPFPSGDVAAPAHPNCRCAVLPA